jgi:hypothetical protein
MENSKTGITMGTIKLLFFSIAESKLLVKLFYKTPDKVLIKKR